MDGRWRLQYPHHFFNISVRIKKKGVDRFRMGQMQIYGDDVENIK